MLASPGVGSLQAFAKARAFDKKRLKQLDPSFQRDLQHGWMLPYLLNVEDLLWSRWRFWSDAMTANRLPDRPIPEIFFGHDGAHVEKSAAWRHLNDCLDLIDPHDSGSNRIELFLDWLLYGFGYHAQTTSPERLSHETSLKLYQFFDLGILLAFPYDYWGDLLAFGNFGKRLGFFPTPHTVVELMVGISQPNITDKVGDPCVGTGRMLLHASNYSVRLYGMDINGTVLKAALVNGYCYAPWLVKPFPFLDAELVYGDRPVEIGGEVMTISQVVATGLLEAAQNDPKAAVYLKGAVYDKRAASSFEPLKKLLILDPPYSPPPHG